MGIIVTVTLSPVAAWPALTSLLPGFPPQHRQVRDLVGAELRELGCREPRGVQGGDPGRCVSHLCFMRHPHWVPRVMSQAQQVGEELSSGGCPRPVVLEGADLPSHPSCLQTECEILSSTESLSCRKDDT